MINAHSLVVYSKQSPLKIYLKCFSISRHTFKFEMFICLVKANSLTHFLPMDNCRSTFQRKGLSYVQVSAKYAIDVSFSSFFVGFSEILRKKNNAFLHKTAFTLHLVALNVKNRFRFKECIHLNKSSKLLFTRTCFN